MLLIQLKTRGFCPTQLPLVGDVIFALQIRPKFCESLKLIMVLLSANRLLFLSGEHWCGFLDCFWVISNEWEKKPELERAKVVIASQMAISISPPLVTNPTWVSESDAEQASFNSREMCTEQNLIQIL
jgi:hypothetical protein